MIFRLTILPMTWRYAGSNNSGIASGKMVPYILSMAFPAQQASRGDTLR
jgi:hypothetical protein